MDPGQRQSISTSSNEEERLRDSRDLEDVMDGEIVNEMVGGNVSAMDYQEDMILDGGSSLQEQPQYIPLSQDRQTQILDSSACQLMFGIIDNTTIGNILVILPPGSWPPPGLPVTMAEALPFKSLNDKIVEDLKKEKEELQKKNEEIKKEIEDLKARMNE